MFYTSVSSGSSNTAGPVELQPLGSGWHKCSITFGTTLFKRLHKVLAPWSYKKLEQKVSLHQPSFFTHIISSVSQGLWSLLCLGTLLMTVSFISFCSPSSLPPSLEQNPLGFKQPAAPTFPTRKPHTAFIAGCGYPLGTGLTWMPLNITNWGGRILQDRGPVCQCTTMLLLTWAMTARELGITQQWGFEARLSTVAYRAFCSSCSSFGYPLMASPSFGRGEASYYTSALSNLSSKW